MPAGVARRNETHSDIYDIRDCSIAAARKFATEAAQFEKDVRSSWG